MESNDPRMAGSADGLGIACPSGKSKHRFSGSLQLSLPPRETESPGNRTVMFSIPEYPESEWKEKHRRVLGVTVQTCGDTQMASESGWNGILQFQERIN